MTDDVGFVLIVIALTFVLLPCRYDPAIRLKEWLEGWHDKG
jgi:hypothetical protein